MWIEETKNGKYKFVERWTDPLTQKQRKTSIVMDKKTAKAQKEAFELIQLKIAKAMEQKTSTGQELTLRGLIELYRKEQLETVKKSTYGRNHGACNTMMAILGEDVIVNKLTAGYIRQKFIVSGKTNSTLNELMKRLKAVLHWGYRNDYIKDVSYLDKLERFKDISHKKKIEDKFLEAGEATILLENMNNIRWRNFTEFLLLSGMRFGEAAALNVSDVDFKENVIHVTKNYDSNNKLVTTPKTESSVRDVYMQDELRTLCQQIRTDAIVENTILRFGKEKLLFPNHIGEHVNNFAYNKYLKETSIKVLGRPITAHVLRHTHASLLMEQGFTDTEIQHRLGHEDSRITKEIYIHITDKLKQKENEKIKAVKLL